MNNNLLTYPNQLRIILRSCKHDRQNTYGLLSIEATEKAMSELSDKALRIWLAICLNQDGYEFALSPGFLKTKCNISESSYHRAVKELKQKGYMKCVQGNLFEFYELPATCSE